MRIGAGTLMMIVGIFLLITFASVLIDYGTYGVAFDLFGIILAVFVVTGGVFCLIKRVWGLCLASALFAVFTGIVSSMGGFSSSNWIAWSLILVGIISTIFVCVTRKEWQKSQAQPALPLSET